MRYNCSVCSKIFTDIKRLISHRTEHSKSQYIRLVKRKCAKKVKLFENNGDYRRHELSHTPSRLCDICGLILPKHTHVENHEDSKKSTSILWDHDYNLYRNKKRGVYSCDECNLKFDGYLPFVQHRNLTHPTHKYECPHCSKLFKKKSLYDLHVEVHDKTLKYQCETCYQPLKNTYQVKTHKFLHSLEGQKCPDCDLIYSFKSIAAYYRHRYLHTGEEYLCVKCGKQFRGKDRYTSHKNKCNRKSIYNCDKCDKVFKTPEGLSQHNKSIHLKERHVCDVCGKELCTLQSLKSHVRVHTGEKPYICSACGVKLSSRSVLKEHMRLHTGEKPYRCEDCDQVFRSDGGLAVHRKRMHEAVKPYSCTLCQKGFVTPYLLKRHLQQVHKCMGRAK